MLSNIIDTKYDILYESSLIQVVNELCQKTKYSEESEFNFWMEQFLVRF